MKLMAYTENDEKVFGLKTPYKISGEGCRKIAQKMGLKKTHTTWRKTLLNAGVINVMAKYINHPRVKKME